MPADSDLVKSITDFLSAMSDECFQPGETKDKTRDELFRQLQLERSRVEHLNAHTYPQYDCQKCSILLTRLQVMLKNLPGIKGIHTDIGHIGNKYVDYGYQEAIKRVINIINSPDFDENKFDTSSKSPYSETVL